MRRSRCAILWLAGAVLVLRTSSPFASLLADGYVEALPGNGTLQTAINTLPAEGGSVHLGYGTYTVTNTLNLTGKRYIQLLGERGAQITLSTKGKPGIDLTDARDISFDNLLLKSGGGSNSPNVGFLLASRESPAPPANFVFRNVRIQGNFTTAPFYAVNCSGCQFYNCDFISYNGQASGFVIAGTNFAGVTSPAAGSLTNGTSGDFSFSGCNWLSWVSVDPVPMNACNLRITSPARDIRVRDSYFTGSGACGFRLDAWEGVLERVTVTALRSEDVKKTNWLKVFGAGTVRQIALRDSILPCDGGPVIDASSLPATELWDVWGNWIYNNYTSLTNGTVGCAFNTLSFSRVDMRRFTLEGPLPWAPVSLVCATNVEFYAEYDSDIVISGSQTGCTFRTSGVQRP